VNQTRSDLVDGLRAVGYAVDSDVSPTPRCAGELLDRAACFIDSALTVAGRPASGSAYIRWSCSNGVLFVEVTHLGRGTFSAVTGNAVARQALDELRSWTDRYGRSLTVDRGPRDEFRITALFEPRPNAASRRPPCRVAELRVTRRPTEGHDGAR
jgi:hypothetical protein